MSKHESYFVKHFRDAVRLVGKFKLDIDNIKWADVDTAGRLLREKWFKFSFKIMVENADLKAHGTNDGFRSSLCSSKLKRVLKGSRRTKIANADASSGGGGGRGNRYIQLLLAEPTWAAGVELALDQDGATVQVSRVDKSLWNAAGWLNGSQPGTPAEMLSPGDVIVSINGLPIVGNTLEEVAAHITAASYTRPLRVTASRDERGSFLARSVPHPVLPIKTVWHASTALGKDAGNQGRSTKAPRREIVEGGLEGLSGWSKKKQRGASSHSSR